MPVFVVLLGAALWAVAGGQGLRRRRERRRGVVVGTGVVGLAHRL
ncbi:MAG: hypothetical protein ACREEQ_10730 [Caulobacteraceae bacterium]